MINAAAKEAATGGGLPDAAYDVIAAVVEAEADRLEREGPAERGKEGTRA